MPRRTVRLTRRRKPRCGKCRGGSRRILSGVTRRRTRGGRRLRNSRVLRKWMSHRAKPWMVSGRGFFGDLFGGIKSVLGPIANLAAPIVSTIAPEFAPLAMGASALLGH
jgi:hypothetical protein